MAAAALRRSAKTTPNRMSTQSWLSNSGQVTEDGSRNPALVLASEQQQSASILTLPQQQDQQTGVQMQSASPLDQPQIGTVQYQPSGNNLEPPSTDALGQYWPTGNDETPLAGDDLNSDVIDNAQLTHLIFRDDACQSVHVSGMWIHTAATSMITLHLALDPEIKPLTFLCFSIFAPLTCLAPTASCAANMHNKEEWNAGITNMTVHEGDEHDRDPQLLHNRVSCKN